MHTRGITAFFVVSMLFIIGIFAFGVWWGNDRLYSPRQFARNYLNALVAKDTNYLAAMPGIGLPSEHAQLLTDAHALGELSNPRITRVIEGNDLTLVNYKITTKVKTLSGSIVLQRRPDTMGLFRSWQFARPPLSSLRLRVVGASSAFINDANVPTSSIPYPVFVPGVYLVHHHSAVLTSNTDTVVIANPSDDPQYATVTAHPSEAFTQLATQQVHSYLDGCTTQRILYPTHCPFGTSISSPISGEPTWHIDQYPVVTLLRYRAGKWPIEDAEGRASVSGTRIDRATGKSVEFRKSVTFSIDLAIQIVNGKLNLVPFAG